jgi:hypothetical protein
VCNGDDETLLMQLMNGGSPESGFCGAPAFLVDIINAERTVILGNRTGC